MVVHCSNVNDFVTAVHRNWNIFIFLSKLHFKNHNQLKVVSYYFPMISYKLAMERSLVSKYVSKETAYTQRKLEAV